MGAAAVVRAHGPPAHTWEVRPGAATTASLASKAVVAGTGAGVPYAWKGGENDNVLPTVSKVEAALWRDRCNTALKRHQQVLTREQTVSNVHGWDTSRPFTQPHMSKKLDRSLATLDDVATSLAEDHVRRHGHIVTGAAVLSHGPIQSLLELGESSTLACASDSGHLWVYNWRDSVVVSQMRKGYFSRNDRHPNGRVLQMTPITTDFAFLGACDEGGCVAVWDLQSTSLKFESRIHEGPVTGIDSDIDRCSLISTSSDTYIMVYDVNRHQVVERALPQHGACGYGVGNTALALSHQDSKMVLVGGKDGKLRMWSKDSGALQRQCTLKCEGGQPTKIKIASDGWRCVVTTKAAEMMHHTGVISPGGVLVFDLRKLSDFNSSRPALLSHCRSGAPWRDHAAAFAVPCRRPATGAIDLALVEEEGETLALCLMDGAVRAFDISQTGAMTAKWDFDSASEHDSGAEPSAIAAFGQYVFVASTAPSLGIWRQTHRDQKIGHEDFNQPPLPPLALTLRCNPQVSRLQDLPGSVCGQVEASLKKDHWHLTPPVSYERIVSSNPLSVTG